MLDKRAIMQGGAVPTVEAKDLKKVWTLISQEKEDGVAVSPVAFLKDCSEGADPMALYIRATLISTVTHHALLRPYFDGAILSDEAIQLASSFPLPTGLQGFDPNAFMDLLAKK